MNGQWNGSYEGSGAGKITVDVDDNKSFFLGTAVVTPDEQKLPISIIGFATRDKENNFRFHTDNIVPCDRFTGDVRPWDEIKARYPENVLLPKSADVTGIWNETSLALSWRTDIETHGRCELPRSKADQASELLASKMNWDEFKEHVSAFRGQRNLYRGQKAQWRLRTTFHRSGRADLVRFLAEDIPNVYRHLSVRTRHKFNLKDPDENGAFFNLLQHHGYPTPLLDWSYSPYVAAFFAYRDISREEEAGAGPNRSVRVLILEERWRLEVNQIMQAARPYPHFSIAEFISLENERMIPQQSVSAITNVDDIESYLAGKAQEIGGGKPYLTAVDLPVSQRSVVFADLSHMGVTAGSLFPGLDGACEELKERNFR